MVVGKCPFKAKNKVTGAMPMNVNLVSVILLLTFNE